MMIWLPALWVACGICLFAGVHFLHVIDVRQHAWRYRSFGLLCVLVSLYIGIGAVMETPADHASWPLLERIHVAGACLVWPVGMWFIALYSRLASWRWWVAASSVVFGLCFLIALFHPHGLLLANIALTTPYTLPWGEQVNQWAGTASPFALAYYAATLAVFVFALWRCAALWRAGKINLALPLGAYLLIQLLATSYSDYTTWQATPSLNWDALPFVALVMLLSHALNKEMHGYAMALDASNAALQRENTRRAEAEATLRAVAYHDATSNLPNRHALQEHLTEQLQAQPVPRCALVVLDPRRFGVINHALGHATGDALIRKLAERLATAAGAGAFVARLSGDEFAAILPLAGNDDDDTTALRRATALRDRLVQPLRLDAYTFKANVSMGVTLLRTREGRSADELLRRAYTALYAAKGEGDDRVVNFTTRMQEDAARRLRLEVDLREALEGDQLRLLYQPQIDVTGRCVGAEALLRWQHPTLGVLSPVEFIGVAETSGQMPALGDWVLRTALATLRTLPPPPDFRLAINVSPWQIFLDGYPVAVRAALAASGVDPHHVTLELTETAFIHDVAGAAQKLRTITAMGVDIAVDDFGTGYAALALLKNFPVRELKIDQSFVRDMALDKPDRLITAMIALGDAMHLRIVAEGVEQEAQRKALLGLGCHVLQGYLIGRPADANALAARLRADASATPTVALDEPDAR